MSNKIDRHGQAAILSPVEIELLFAEGLQADRERALFGLCPDGVTSKLKDILDKGLS